MGCAGSSLSTAISQTMALRTSFRRTAIRGAVAAADTEQLAESSVVYSACCPKRLCIPDVEAEDDDECIAGKIAEQTTANNTFASTVSKLSMRANH